MTDIYSSENSSNRQRFLTSEPTHDISQILLFYKYEYPNEIEDEKVINYDVNEIEFKGN